MSRLITGAFASAGILMGVGVHALSFRTYGLTGNVSAAVVGTAVLMGVVVFHGEVSA
jgi:hypothetical protein